MKVQPPTERHQLLHIMDSTERSQVGKSYWAMLNPEKTNVIESDRRYFCCPYGQPGDRLWVREAHAFVPEPAYRRSTGIYQQINPSDAYEACVYRENFDRARNFPWRPSIHMPRWASRILLEITDVRVERLQDISEEQALTEGVHYDSPHRAYFGTDTGGIACNSARCAFADLWQSINGPGSWDANPFVWAVSFKVIQPPQEHHHD